MTVTDQHLGDDATGKAVSLLALRVATAGLLFWWGLAKALNTGVGTSVSNKFYGGYFSIDWLLISFGWLQVVAAVLIAIGALRVPMLWFQLIVNVFVALSIWQSLLDPFWLWMPGEKPGTVNALFYPSLIVVAASWLSLAFRDQDRFAVDAMLGGRSAT
ncbi:MAG: hypothetical protein AAGC70_16015 [Pseudomonadota bacterium]